MTLADYMNKELFPLTSHEDCSPRNQMSMDGFNLANLNSAIKSQTLGLGKPLTSRELLVKAELDRKVPHQAEVVAELKAQEMAAKFQTAELAPV